MCVLLARSALIDYVFSIRSRLVRIMSHRSHSTMYTLYGTMYATCVLMGGMRCYCVHVVHDEASNMGQIHCVHDTQGVQCARSVTLTEPADELS